MCRPKNVCDKKCASFDKAPIEAVFCFVQNEQEKKMQFTLYFIGERTFESREHYL